MALNDKQARVGLGLVAASLCAAALVVDFPGRSEGQFWSDGATYYSMAWSLAEDLDLRYEVNDLYRVRREFPAGPQGVFLKRASGGLQWDPGAGFPWLHRIGPDEPRIYYAKSFAHTLFAAPLVALFGTPGLMLTNALAMIVALFLGYALARRREEPAAALAWTLVLLLGTITPLYLIWPQPEILNIALIVAGLWSWARSKPMLAAVLLGIATYSKPTNLFLALPLGVEPLLPVPGRSFARGFRESLRRGAVMAAVVVAFYGANAVVTGEINYQGGERKTFYDRFPGQERGVTFGNSGFWMTTNQVGPLVEGEDQNEVARGSGPPLAAKELRGAFFANLGYFWVGRYAGATVYYLPVVAAMLLFLILGPRAREGVLGLASLIVSYLFYIWLIPANWYGGGGTVGNRYFLNLVPLGFLLLPRGRAWIASGAGGLAAAVLLLPIFSAPFFYSSHPGRHAVRWPFKVFPAELTMLNDLSFCIEKWRCKQPVGDTIGDLHKHWPADPRSYYLYFPDDETEGGLFDRDAERGFRLRPASRAEVILRALEPVRTTTFEVSEGAPGTELRIRVGNGSGRVVLDSKGSGSVTIETALGLLYYDTFLHVIRFELEEDSGAPFVSIAIEVDQRQH